MSTTQDRTERLVTTVLGRLLPARLTSDAAADLLEDHRRERSARGPVRAAWFLLREGLSLAMSFVWRSAQRWLRSTWLLKRDALHAARSLMRRPGSSAAAVLMLAAGLSAVVSAWALSSTILYQPIGLRDAESVRRIAATDRSGRIILPFAEAELAYVRAGLGDGSRLAAVFLLPAVLRVGDADAQTLAEVVNGPYFDLVGLRMRLGRPLLDVDARPGAEPAVVISDALWRNRFERSPSALGATLRLNGHPFTIVGVVNGPGSSMFLGASVDAWVTTAQADTVLNREWRTSLTDRFWTAIAAVDAGGSAALDEGLARATGELARRIPDPWRDRTLITLPGTVLAGSQRDAAASLAMVLSGFALLILLAAAANVGGMLLGSGAAERGRAAILLALGAGRSSIIRRHLIEGGALGFAGGACALGVYAWVRTQIVNVALLPTLSLHIDLPFDGRIILLTLGAGVLAGVLLSLGPALWITRLDLAHALRDGSGRAAGAASLSRPRRILVAAQVAISVTLLVGAALFARSVSTLAALDVGFARDGLIAMDFDVEPSGPAPEALPGLAREALARAAAMPGVVAATMSNRAPIDASTPAVSLTTAGSTSRPLDDVTFYLGTAAYFDTVGVPILRGRAFTEDESDREADVAIVNETLASRLWPDGDVLGRGMTLEPEGRTVRIVGVARDSKYRALSEAARPHFYLPTSPNFGQALLVRTRDDARLTIGALQRMLDGVGPGLIGFFPRTLEDHLAIDMLPTKAAARSALLLGVVALLLSATGLYGIVMWFVEVRRREIAVRLALGASTSMVRRLVVRQAMSAAAPGLVIGVAMAVGLAAFGRSMLVGVGPLDPVAIGVGIAAILAVVAAASYLPSRGATRVDPMGALRAS